MINLKLKLKSYYQKQKRVKNKITKKFRRDYHSLLRKRKYYNHLFVQKELEETKNLFNDINGCSLDNNQRNIIVNDEQNTLVIAGAGSGKTLTIIGKVKYLIERKNVKQKDILCISFTNETTNSLKNKLNNLNYNDIKVMTFHKLALQILKNNNESFIIDNTDTLEYLIDEYFIVNTDLIPFLSIYFGIKKDEYDNYIDNHPYQLTRLKKVIARFIHLYKATYLDYSIYEKILSNKIINKKEYILLRIIEQIHKLYDLELQSTNKLDFDDLLIKGIKTVREKGLIKKYKYIIIDEFQDTSYIKLLFIKEILNNMNAHLFVVGDDFQSIYRFTGCNLDLFLNFKKHFIDCNILKIEKTYRNPNELINVAGKFIMKNDKQKKKKLYSDKCLSNPIQIVYYNNKQYIFKKLILSIYNETKKEIMVLGRNNKDIMTVIDNDFSLKEDGTVIYLKNPNISIKYYTVHTSKGLEANNVIIINLEDKVLGFPSQIEDDKILRYISKRKEYYPFEEERRLFYVALTRTKNKVYLLTPIKNESIFVKELLKYKNVSILKK